MKKLILFAALALWSAAVVAQVEPTDKTTKKKRQSTTVIVIGENTEDNPVKVIALEYFKKTFTPAFREVGMPRFMITDHKAKAIFAVGGFVNFRTAYDFNSVLPNLDFVTYNIPPTRSSGDAGRVLMDGSTSRLYFKTVISTNKGPLQAYIETDFRGTNYALRLRQAYVSFMGFTLGQTVTTFCDQSTSFNTIDFEGPNGYTYGRNLMIRYHHAWKNGLSAAIAVEYPVVSATYGTKNEAIYQRVPDIPFYIQYAWNDNKSHVRASAVLRNMYYRNLESLQTIDQIGWGVQLSATWAVGAKLQLYGQIVYGLGITPYISDLQGSGMDMIGSSKNGTMKTPGQLAWLAGMQVMLTPKMPFTLGYSQVEMSDTDKQMAGTDYQMGRYAVANLFYNFSPSWSVGAEYLYGTRTNFDGTYGQSQRFQMAVQLNF
ncbi:MAG: DcaP family trimeric outer membrane transporter [Mucinivorans sp.]